MTGETVGGAPSARGGAHPWLGRVALAFVLFSLAALVVLPLLVQRRVNDIRASVEDVAEPARTLVTRLQFTLSREMSSLRGFLITGQEGYLDAYSEALRSEHATRAELEPLAERLGPGVLKHLVQAGTLADQWHARADDDEIVRLRRASPQYLAQIPTEQALFAQAMAATNALDSAIVAAATRGRARIRRAESTGLVLSAALGLLAVCAAAAVAGLYRRLGAYAGEAERRRLQAEAALADTARATEARARLLRGVTHDVKNPLGAAHGYTELLSMGVRGALSPAQAEMVAGVRRCIDNALAIIGDLLDVARADGGRLSVHAVEADLARIVAEAVDEHRAAAERAGHVLHLEPCGPAPVLTDPARVRQVLGNLLSNAIKYTPAPGHIRVIVDPRPAHAAPGPGRWMEVRVEDDGPGIPAASRESIFDEFTRLPDASGASGHGLGLAISRRVARLLGGDLGVRGEAGQGAVFVLWLPDAAPGVGALNGSGPAEHRLASVAHPPEADGAWN